MCIYIYTLVSLHNILCLSVTLNLTLQLHFPLTISHRHSFVIAAAVLSLCLRSPARLLKRSSFLHLAIILPTSPLLTYLTSFYLLAPSPPSQCCHRLAIGDRTS